MTVTRVSGYFLAASIGCEYRVFGSRSEVSLLPGEAGVRADSASAAYPGGTLAASVVAHVLGPRFFPQFIPAGAASVLWSIR
jgi:hypothetical protein